MGRPRVRRWVLAAGRSVWRDRYGRRAVPSTVLGQKQTCAAQKVMSALPLKADMCGALADVR